MGLISPLHNVKGTSVSRPPLIVFVICLFVCASATIGLGFFIQYSETVVNPEVKDKWVKFLNRLAAKKFCLSVPKGDSDLDPGPIAQFIDGGPLNSTNSRNETSITVSSSLKLTGSLGATPGMVAVYGDIPVGEWAAILDTHRPIDSVRVTFGISSGVFSHDNVCVILTVPSWFLAESRRSTVCVPTLINKTIAAIGNLDVRTSGGSNDDGNYVCQSGSPLKITFKSDEEFHLSKVEKLNIYFRLVHAGYFLFALAFVLISFSIFRRKGYTPVVANDRVPWTL